MRAVKTLRYRWFVMLLGGLLFLGLSPGDGFSDIIIDNGDSGTSSTGVWGVSGGSEPYDGIDSLWSRDGATYTWEFDSQPAGTYEVLMWWSQWASRSTDIDVTVNYYGDSETTSVNQQQGIGQWNSIGTYNFNGSGSVILTADFGSSVSSCADAVWFRLVSENMSPEAYIDSIDPSPALPGQTVTMTGHGDDLDGSISAYRWESNIYGLIGEANSVSTSLLSDGTHTISLTVQDNDGEWSQAVSEVLIIGDVPVEVIIDNLDDAQTSETGTWQPSSGLDPYGDDSVWSRNGATFTWDFTPPEAGAYDVSMWWTEWSSRGVAAVDIVHAGGTDRVSVNQQEEGGQWNILGTYFFDGAGSVTLIATNPSPTSYCADAVKFNLGELNEQPTAFIDSISPSSADQGQLVSFDGHGEDTDGTIASYSWASSINGVIGDVNSFSSSALSVGVHEISLTVYDDKGMASEPALGILTITGVVTEIIIDNGNPNGTWSVSGAPDPYGDDSLWSRGGTTYTWTFTPPTSSYYRVSMYWTGWESRTTSAPVDVEHAGGSSRYYVNQQQNPSQWNSIGELYFEAGTSYDVTITSQSAPSSTCADAVMFEPIEQPSPLNADFGVNTSTGYAPLTVQFTDQSVGAITNWAWQFGDGQSSTQANPSHQYTNPGSYSVSLTVSNSTNSDTESKTNYISVSQQTSGSENIYLCHTYAGNANFIPLAENMLSAIGAGKSNGVWTYENSAKGMTYYIYTVTDVPGMEAALKEQGSHVIIAGHANFGFGSVFVEDPSEWWLQRIDNISFIDDDRFVNYSTDMVSTKVDGMKYGQSYPNWEPAFQNGQTAIMPYNFGDPRGNPPYNYRKQTPSDLPVFGDMTMSPHKCITTLDLVENISLVNIHPPHLMSLLS